MDINEINNLEQLTDYLKLQDNSKNCFYLSKIPEQCKDLPCAIGIDEAGRGPVLGPMVYGMAVYPLNKVSDLIGLGCADSKVLTEETRNKIFVGLCELSDRIAWAVDVISSNTISNNMLSRCKYSLNKISMDSAVNLIKSAIDAGVNVQQVYVDTVGKPEKYQEYLLSLFPKLNITVAKKADSTYPIVSAASIFAKVTRDHMISVWEFQEGIKVSSKGFGSGYPGDPATKSFMEDYIDPVFGYPMLVRFSWSTAANILEESAYHVEWENVEEETEAKTNTNITSFFSLANKQSINNKKKHDFFVKRNLKNTNEL